MIRAWCLRWGAQSSDADDVAQQVLIKLLAAMKTYQKASTSGFRSWLKTVTHNAWIDFVRRPRTGPAPEWLESVADSFDAPRGHREGDGASLRAGIARTGNCRVEPASSRPPGKPSA